MYYRDYPAYQDYVAHQVEKTGNRNKKRTGRQLRLLLFQRTEA